MRDESVSAVDEAQERLLLDCRNVRIGQAWGMRLVLLIALFVSSHALAGSFAETPDAGGEEPAAHRPDRGGGIPGRREVPLALRIPVETLAAGVVGVAALGSGYLLLERCDSVLCFGTVMLTSFAAQVLGSAGAIALTGNLLGGQGDFLSALYGTGGALATAVLAAGLVGAALAHGGAADRTTGLAVGGLLVGLPAATGVLTYELRSAGMARSSAIGTVALSFPVFTAVF
jgi:hypothetical protein